MNIYEQVLANIDADPKAWCQDEWALHEREDGTGKVISRCLVEHIDFATGVSYVKPNGKRFVSKNPKRWTQRNKVLAQLASLLPKGERHSDGYETVEVTRDQIDKAISWGDRAPVVTVPAENSLVTFNDKTTTTRTKVRNLLKRAAKRFPED